MRTPESGIDRLPPRYRGIFPLSSNEVWLKTGENSSPFRLHVEGADVIIERLNLGGELSYPSIPLGRFSDSITSLEFLGQGRPSVRAVFQVAVNETDEGRRRYLEVRNLGDVDIEVLENYRTYLIRN